MKSLKLLVLALLIVFAGIVLVGEVRAYGDCSQYGMMAIYEDYTNSCKCMSGYVFGKLVGSDYCVSGDSICHDKYGYDSRYDSSSRSCECDYGYVFGEDSIGRTQCVSPDSICKTELGYSSRYNSLSNKCECSYGYVIHGGQCTYGNQVCSLKHGMYSSYDASDNSCNCDDGYTLDDNGRCVEKENNVYYKLLELDVDGKEAFIRSEYDGSYYHIRYNSGCYASSFKRYLNRLIVINLGTDFYLDTWDRIVLQDDDEVCDVTQRTKVYSDFTLYPNPEENIFVESTYIPTPVVNVEKVLSASQAKKENAHPIAVTSSDTTPSPTASTTSAVEIKESWFKKFTQWLFGD
jgi:hypothetical protein